MNAIADRVPGSADHIEDVIVGCVSQVGAQAGNIGRNMVLASKLPEHIPGTAVDRQCGSSQQALHFAAQAVMSGTQDVVIAAGVEHMTSVPIGANVADGACPVVHRQPYALLHQRMARGSALTHIVCACAGTAAATTGVKAGHGLPMSEVIAEKYMPALSERGQKFFSQFEGAELVAEKYEISRLDMEEFAVGSHPPERSEAGL